MSLLSRAYRSVMPKHLQWTIDMWRLISFRYGHYNSIKEWRPQDDSGESIPWYTYPAVDFIRQFDFSSMRVFEFGGGYSTLFWAKNAKEVVSVEHDKEWYARIKKSLPDNVNFIYKYTKDVPAVINDFEGTFDLIAIDSCFRNKCAINAVNKLSEGGIIILDNADWHQVTTNFLREIGMTQVDFIGMSPVNNFISATSIFFRSNYNFPHKYHARPPHLYCGIAGVENIKK